MDLAETIQKIIPQTKLTPSQIKEKIDEQIKELSGLIDEEGAIVIVAKNLGVDLKEHQEAANLDVDQKIGELAPNKNTSVVGRIVSTGSVRTFNKKDGSEGTFLPFVLEDTSGMIRCVAWGSVNTQISNEQGFTKGEILRIVHGFVKQGKTNALEIHIGAKSRMQLQPDNIDIKMIPTQATGSPKITPIKDITISMPFVNIEGIISRVFEPKSFNRKDGTQGNRASLSLRGENDIVFVTFWGEHCAIMKGIQENQFVQITYLTPKPNYRDNSKIDLTATTNTEIIPLNASDSKIALQIEKVASETHPIQHFLEKGEFGNIEGKIQEIEDLLTIKTKDGREIPLMKIIVADESTAIRINLWGDKVDPQLKVNGVYRFNEVTFKINNYSNQNEGTLTRTGTITQLTKDIETTHTVDVKSQSLTSKEMRIEEINQAEFCSIRATIIKDISQITTYRACSKCNKKVDNCTCDSPGDSVNRMILNVTLDDETGILRATLMGERAEKFLNTPTDRVVELKDAGEIDQFLKRKNMELVGREFQFKGKTKYSDYSSRYEMIIRDYEDLDPKEEIRQILEHLDNQ
ncbi:MAG: hypothetical protein E4G98_02885 [Promethearchaeota archaeon]|nr:MAG: hypothetical protein E4G98_02885 [Candidatus Lokiarchaeota archaeon]